MSRHQLCACVDTVMTEGQGSVAVATCSDELSEAHEVNLSLFILQRTRELNLPAHVIVDQIRSKMRASVISDMNASEEDLKSYLEEAVNDRMWGNETVGRILNSSASWVKAVKKVFDIKPATLGSIVMTLHYAKQTWMWLNRRDEWDVSRDPHPFNSTMVQVSKFIEFENLEGVTYYVSRKVVYLATQIFEEEASAALFVLLQGLQGPIAPFSYQ